MYSELGDIAYLWGTYKLTFYATCYSIPIRCKKHPVNQVFDKDINKEIPKYTSKYFDGIFYNEVYFYLSIHKLNWNTNQMQVDRTSDVTNEVTINGVIIVLNTLCAQ